MGVALHWPTCGRWHPQRQTGDFPLLACAEASYDHSLAFPAAVRSDLLPDWSLRRPAAIAPLQKISPALCISGQSAGLKLAFEWATWLKWKVTVVNEICIRIPAVIFRRLVVSGMAYQVILADLLRHHTARKQPCVVQGHSQDAAHGLVGLDADKFCRLHVLPSQVQQIVAAVENRHGPRVAVQGL